MSGLVTVESTTPISSRPVSSSRNWFTSRTKATCDLKMAVADLIDLLAFARQAEAGAAALTQAQAQAILEGRHFALIEAAEIFMRAWAAEKPLLSTMTQNMRSRLTSIPSRVICDLASRGILNPKRK